MTQAALFIPPSPQFFDNNGNPLSGGKIYFYQPGTTTPKSVYNSSAETTALSNPVILDAYGRAKIWLDGYYRVVLNDSSDILVWTEDNVSSAYFPSASATVTMSEWQQQSDVPTYIGATQFSVPGDKTAVYSAGRRVKATVTAGTIAGNIITSAAGGNPVITTVTVLWDLSEALDSGLIFVYTGIISPVASGTPYQLPIGAILPWYKTMTGTPTLCYGWVECNGQTLSDPLSPLNGQVIPNLNGSGSGADTFSNSKTAVFLRGGLTSGNYTADAIKAHNHGSSNLTAATHSHTSGNLGTDTVANHLHNVTIAKAIATVQSGSGTSSLWQNGSGSNQSQNSDANGTHSHAVNSGSTDLSGALALTGSTDNNGAATETIPKTVTAVMIMRVK